MISVTITDRSGRTLSGQTIEAFWITIAHARPFSVGLNCALGAAEMRPYLAELSRVADCWTSCYPNAGLPNAFGEYDEMPEQTAARAGRVRRRAAWSTCWAAAAAPPRTTSAAIAAAAEGRRPGAVPPPERLHPPRRPRAARSLRPDANFLMIGERTNVTGSRRFADLILAGDYTTALEVATEQVRSGANIIDVNMDEAMLDSEAAMTTFLNMVATEPEIARVPIMVDSSKWSVIEAGLRCVQGKPVVNSISLKEGEEEFLDRAREARRYGAAMVVMAFDEQGQADTVERKVAICERAYRLLVEEAGVPPRDIIFDPNVFAVATGIEEHNGYAMAFIEATRRIKERLPGREGQRRRQQPVLLVPRQRRRARGDARAFLYHAIRAGHGHGHRQRRPARRLRADRRGAARGRRGRPLRPPPRRHRAARRAGRAGARGRRRARGRRGLAGRAPSRSASSTPWSTASSTTSRPTPRRPAAATAPRWP